ncbi:outer membrane protein with beta-barrel domain [Luteibacter rhizovicinus]|uniref:Outer membrane protein with beta-barrel domain n=1 Tax=Luteibacter rhizovicinus TaxID=242606 RepID=A0A4R3YTU1_9GAMM|nr:outer membrane beta-barrel protein [Luteibacter rhizovicinus]TCV94563.1 outer membrane protein with beta-barrel domain [Luteibacter rhizovicinus]
MKKVLSAVVLASALYLAASVTYANDGEAFVAVNAGQSRFDPNQLLAPYQSGLFIGSRYTTFDRINHSFGISAGYRWTVWDTIKLGFEGGYVDLGEGAGRYHQSQFLAINTVDIDQKRKEKAKAPFLGINGRWTIADKWSLMARAGIARYKSTLTINTQYWLNGVDDGSTHYTQEWSKNAYYYGVAVGYDITPHLDVALSFDEHAPKVHLDHLTEKVHVRVSGIRAEYRF